MKKGRPALILFGAILCFITVMMLVPKPPQIAAGFRFIDKLEHTAAFSLMSFLLTAAIARKRVLRLPSAAVSVACLTVYGILIEFLQQFTGRSPELGDIIADFAGSVIGGLVALFFL